MINIYCMDEEAEVGFKSWHIFPTPLSILNISSVIIHDFKNDTTILSIEKQSYLFNQEKYLP